MKEKSQLDKVFLSLVKCAVCGKSDESFVFGENDRTEIIKMSNQQAIPAFVIDGLQKCLMTNPDNNPFVNETAADKLKRIQWFGHVVANEHVYAKHEKAMTDLAQLYANNGIRMMVVKGYGLSLDWPVPNHRPVGDLDIYNFGKWKEADAFVAKECGIRVVMGMSIIRYSTIRKYL